MADDKRKARDSAEGAGRRPPPTIDLTAKEIKSGEQPAASAMPPSDQPIYSEHDNLTDTPTRDFLSGASENSKPAAAAVAAARSRWPFVLAGLAGGILVSAVLFTLWLTGMVPIRYAGATAMRARVTALEMQVHDLSKKPQPVADTKEIEAITTRLAKIEQTLTAMPAGNAADSEKLSAIDSNLKALGLALAGLSRRADEIAASTLAAREQAETSVKATAELRTALEQLPPAATRADTEKLLSRIATLEDAAKASSQHSANTVSASAAVKLALSAIALREAATAGAPYAAELEAVKASGGDTAPLAPLEPFATTGIPDDAALARDLTALLPAMITAAGVKDTAGGGFLGRLQANAEKLVRVRPVNEPPGSDPLMVIARIESLASRNNVAAARSEIAKLPPGPKQTADGWIKKAVARDAALAAARTLAANAVNAMTKQ